MSTFSVLFVLTLVILIPTAAFLRLLFILPVSKSRPRPRQRGNPTHLLIVLGSGGHTAEMLSMLYPPGFKTSTYTHRSYIIGEGDAFSAQKAKDFEDRLAMHGSDDQARPQEDHAYKKISQRGSTKDRTQQTKYLAPGSGDVAKGYTIHTVPRARKIHQSLLTTPISCLHCLSSTLTLLHSHPNGRPDLILTNGPATALIVILASLLLDFFAVPQSPPSTMSGKQKQSSESRRTRSIYIESWARVKQPSLSCKIIVWAGLCDRVLVQWRELEERGWGEYKGVLVR